MSDESVRIQSDASGNHKVDGENVTGHEDGIVFRQRVEVCGAALLEVARVKNGAVNTDDYALATRGAPNATSYDKWLSKHLTDDGLVPDGSNELATGNYAGGVQRFYRGPAADKVWVVERMLITVQDTGAFDSGKYGNNITLTNGISVEVFNGSTVDLDLTDTFKIKTNAGWAHFCHDVTLHNFGTGDDTMTVRWTFARAGKSLILDGSASQVIAVNLNDDFTGLTGHYFIMQGYELDS